MDPQNFPHWRNFVNVCLALLVIMIFGEFIAPELMEHEIGQGNLAVMELVLSLIVLMDIAISFVKTSDKKTFLKKNIFKIIAVFPWGVAFRGLALLRVEAELPFLAQIFAVESEAVAAERVAGGAGRSFRLITKLKELIERI